MRTSTIVILVLIILGSCKSDEKTILVYSNETESYRISISTIETKINQKGKAQCSNYMTSIRSDSLYDSYGLDLPAQVANSLLTSKKYLIAPELKSLNKKYLKIRIENLSEQSLNYDSILHLGLKESFNLAITPISKEIEGYQLEITDANKLNNNLVECRGGTTKYYKGIFSATSVNLSGVTKIIDQNMTEYFDSNIDNDQCYKLEFVVNRDINKINANLKEYGLRYEKANYDQVFYEINTSIARD